MAIIKEDFAEFLSGNVDGIRPIRNAYQEALVIYALDHGAKSDVAEDVVAFAFSELSKKAGQIKHEKQVLKFLYKTVWYRCQNEERVEKNWMHSADLEDIFESPEPPIYDVMESNIIRAYIWRLILTKLDHLPPKRRDDFRAYYLQSKSYKQIAMERGAKEITVRQNVDYALKAIRKHLKNKGFAKLPPFLLSFLLLFILKIVCFFFIKNAER